MKDLHLHLSGATSPVLLFEMICETGIKMKTKQYELCIEGTCLRMEYFLPEEIRVVGEINGVSYHKARG